MKPSKQVYTPGTNIIVTRPATPTTSAQSVEAKVIDHNGLLYAEQTSPPNQGIRIRLDHVMSENKVKLIPSQKETTNYA